VIEIRPLTGDDAAAIQESLLGDPEIAAWFRSTGPFTLAECEEMVVRKVAHRVTHRFGWSLAWEDDRCVGWGIAQYCIVDGVVDIEIGWTVARSHWRRGLATRLARHVLAELSAREIKPDTIVAYTRIDNVASRGVMDKLGMTYEKDFVFYGEPHVLYRMPLPDPAPVA
jgi:RimJ/RimL family protein N-acetyltransferase